MALKLNLSRVAINSTGTEMYIADTTGEYSEDNVGGYGGINPIRNTLAVLYSCKYNSSTGSEVVEILPYDPETVETITLNTTKDGYYEVIAVAVPKTTPVVEGNYGYVNGSIVKLVEGQLVTKTVEEVYADPLYLNGVSFKTVILARIAITRSRLNLEIVKLYQAKNEDRAHNRVIADKDNQFKFVKGLLEGARYLWCSDNYTGAQLVVESFNELEV